MKDYDETENLRALLLAAMQGYAELVAENDHLRKRLATINAASPVRAHVRERLRLAVEKRGKPVVMVPNRRGE